MRKLLSQVKWQFTILHRNNLIAISIAVTALYGLIFFFIKDLANVDKFLTLLIYNDPAIIGLFFVGLTVIMEKNQGVLPLYFVSPLNKHTYLISRILTLSILGCLCALAMVVAVKGFAFYIPYFLIGTFGTCLLFSILGILIVANTTDFLLFMLKSIPILLIMSLPLLNYFELANIAVFTWWPIHGSLTMIAHSYHHDITSEIWIEGCVSILIWVPILYTISYRYFKSRTKYL